jgi:hypothetical protein
MTDRTGPKISSRAIRICCRPVKDRRRDEPAAAVLADAAATDDGPGALGLARIDVAEDLLHVALRDERPDPGRVVHRVADDPVALDEADEPVQERPLHPAIDEEPAPGGAVLAHVPEDRVRDAIRDPVQVRGIGHDDLRALAAELQGDPLEVRLRGVLQDRPADLRRAREGDAVDPG